ncbi:MAG: hypothetical protein IKO47_01240 [Ruminococcus sp.]|nr:hypothetical protein [Ruminococcus sp.]
MKYIVMECHKGYAVLMDEDSAFVKAANLNYEVGQTVTTPVLMESEEGRSRRKNRIIMSVAAAAACLTIICGTGYHYYSVNYKTHSTVIISSNAGVKLYLNKKDKVIKIESMTPEGEAVLSDYSGKGKDKNDAVSDIVGISKSKGYIADGDTVSVYIPDTDSSFSNEIKQDLAVMHLNADVQPIEKYNGEQKPVPPTAPQTPEPVSEGIAPPEPPAAGKNDLPTAPVPPETPTENEGLTQPPEPPTDDVGLLPDQPEPPKPPEETLPHNEKENEKGIPGREKEEHTKHGGRLPHERANAGIDPLPSTLPDTCHDAGTVQ